MFDFFDFFTNHDFVLNNLLFTGALLLIFFVLLFYTPILSKIFLPVFGFKKYSEYLPFSEVIKDNSTVKLKDGTLVRGFFIGGIQTGMISVEENERFFEIKQTLFNQIKDSGVNLRFYTIRTKSVHNSDYEFDQVTLQRIYDKWKKQGLKIFNNENYLLLSVSGVDAQERINRHTDTILSVLGVYKINLLKHSDGKNLATLFSKILSPVSKPNVTSVNQNLNKMIATDNVDFLNDGQIKFDFGSEAKYAGLVSFNFAPDYINTAFFEAAQGLQSEMIIMNAFTFLTVKNTERFLRLKHASESSNRNSTEVVVEQIEQAYEQTDENVSGNQTFTNFYPLFVVIGKNQEEVQDSIAGLRRIASEFGISPVVEKFAAKESFFSMIPGFNDFPRGFNILSAPAAAALPLSYVPAGVANSDFGPDPIVVFPTSAGTPYQFQFHVSDKPGAVGHTLVIGPTGGGKTTLFSFLIAQSLRHPKLKAFFFDRNRGAQIFTMATGGKYINLQNRSENLEKSSLSFNAKLNPLKMDNTESNRAFLRKWLAMLAEAEDATDLDEIARAVSVVFDYLDDRNKLLKNLHVACFSSGGKVRSALKKWVDPLQYGDVFNEQEDTLDLFSRLTTFDFTDVLNDATMAPAVISYILHRINTLTISNGNPALIMIDETAPMLENKMFRDNFITGLQEGRKNRQCYMAAFQRANIVDKLGIGDVVRGQAQTVLFFRNPAATAEDYKYWNLNPTEMAFIKGQAYPNIKRGVLLSRPVTGESVILNTELGGLGNLIRLFESGRPSVLLAEDLYKQFGNNFVDEYLRRFDINE